MSRGAFPPLPAFVAVVTVGLAFGCGKSPLFSLGGGDGGAGLDTRAVAVADASAADGRAIDGGGPPQPGDALPSPSDAGALPRDGGRDVSPADGAVVSPADGGGLDRGAVDAAPVDRPLDARPDAGSDAAPGDLPDARPADGSPLPEPPLDGGARDGLALDATAPDGGPPAPDGGGLRCDLVRQDCPAGQRCEIDFLPSGILGLLCVADLGGAGDHGAACRSGPADCRRGASCVQDVDRTGAPVGGTRCNAFCLVDSDCPAGSFCAQTTFIEGGQRLPVSICWP